MSRPDRQPLQTGCILAIACAFASLPWLAGCASSGRAVERDSLPPALPPASAVELIGRVRGPLPGVSEQANLHVILRGDGAVWAQIRREPGDGPAIHEVLLWTDDLALLFDRRSLKSTELGESPGIVEAWGGRFGSSVALWILGGIRAAGPSERASWEGSRGEWRGRHAETGLRRPVREPLSWAEVVWREPAGRLHTLRAQPEAHRELHGGVRWPARLGVEGTDLRARLVVDWDEIHWHSALGDSILDPLWEPPRP